MAVGAPTTHLAWLSCETLSNRSSNCRCLLSSWAAAGLSPDHRQSPQSGCPEAACGRVRLLVGRKLQLAAWPVVPWDWSTFHRSSEPGVATDWMQAVMTFLQLAGERSICPASRRSRAIASFPFFSQMA